MSRFFFILVSALFLFQQAYACSCFRESFERKYCSAKLSVVGTVLARTDNCPGKCDPIKDQGNGQITYIVKVQKKFKGVTVEDNIMYLNTAVNGALCGINLTVGETYLFNLGEKISSNDSCPKTFWNISLCSFPQVYKSLTAAQKKFLAINSRTNDALCKKISK